MVRINDLRDLAESQVADKCRLIGGLVMREQDKFPEAAELRGRGKGRRKRGRKRRARKYRQVG